MRSVADARCVSVPLLPVMVSVTAYGTVLPVVDIVNVDEPEPLIVEGLKLPLTPVGNPDSLVTVSATAPVKPSKAVTLTVYVASPPGVTSTAAGPAVMLKSPVVGSTVIVRVGGCGSELPLESITVSDAV